MRIRFIVILFISMFLILISSIVINYKAVEKTQENIEKTLINKILPNKESTKSSEELKIKKAIEVYLAFSKKQAIEITRDSLKYYLIVVLIMSTLFIFSFFSITRPIKELSKRVNNLLRDDKLSTPIIADTFKPRGSYEVKQLYISFESLTKDLKEYERLVGDRARYRGWKEIARIIVHEINNLVSPIETYSGYLLETSTGDKREKAEEILLKIQEIKTTLAKFRDLAHLPEPKPKSINLYTLTKRISDEFDHVSFTATPADSHFPGFVVETDPILLGEILRNLIKNAVESIKSKENHQKPVEVKVKRDDNTLGIEIIDMGPGIPEEIIDKIFKPGFSTKEGNIGIGLSIVKSLSEQLGIKTELESTPGVGTTFRIILTNEDER